MILPGKADMNPAVFIDRDGVLNQAIVRDGKPYPPERVEDVIIPAGANEALRSIKASGYLIIVVTNQPDVGKGLQSKQIIDAIHGALRQQLQIDAFRVCYHVDEDKCNCRKPKPGMILDAAREFKIDLARSFMIGDRWRDIEAGNAAGCKTILIQPETPYRETPARGMSATFHSLGEAATFIVGQTSVERRG